MEEWGSFPISSMRDFLTCEDHGGSYMLCLLREPDEQRVAAVPVAKDLRAGKLLLCLSSATSVAVPAAPTGAVAEAHVEMQDASEEIVTDKVYFCVVDQAFIDSGRLREFKEGEGGQLEESYSLFGPDGDCAPISGGLVEAARTLGFLPPEFGEADVEPGYVSASSMPASLRLPLGAQRAKGLASRVPRGSRVGAGRGKPTVAGLAEQLASAMDRIAAQEERISQMQPGLGDLFDEEDVATGSLVFEGVRGVPSDFRELQGIAGAPPVVRQMGAAFVGIDPGTAMPHRSLPPRRGGGQTPGTPGGPSGGQPPPKAAPPTKPTKPDPPAVPPPQNRTGGRVGRPRDARRCHGALEDPGVAVVDEERPPRDPCTGSPRMEETRSAA